MQDSCELPCLNRGKHAIHLWQFLKELLLQPQAYHGCIRWLDRARGWSSPSSSSPNSTNFCIPCSSGIFKIEDSARVAKLWGQRKNRPAMNYDKLSRSIRQYYKKGIIKKTENSKRLVYQFQPQYR
jgi:SAM pointed domain-containing ETS transcription factor